MLAVPPTQIDQQHFEAISQGTYLGHWTATQVWRDQRFSNGKVTALQFRPYKRRMDCSKQIVNGTLIESLKTSEWFDGRMTQNFNNADTNIPSGQSFCFLYTWVSTVPGDINPQNIPQTCRTFLPGGVYVRVEIDGETINAPGACVLHSGQTYYYNYAPYNPFDPSQGIAYGANGEPLNCVMAQATQATIHHEDFQRFYPLQIVGGFQGVTHSFENGAGSCGSLAHNQFTIEY